MSNTDSIQEVAEATEVKDKVKADEAPKMSRQDENWEMVTFLNFPWQDADKIDAEDRSYLLNKAEEIKLEVLRRRKTEMEEMERQKQQQQQQGQLMQQQQQMLNAQQQGQQPQPPQPTQGQPPWGQQGSPQWGQPPQQQ